METRGGPWSYSHIGGMFRDQNPDWCTTLGCIGSLSMANNNLLRIHRTISQLISDQFSRSGQNIVNHINILNIPSKQDFFPYVE